MVEERTLERYKAEAKAAGKESWYLSWVLDQNAEERQTGKTIEIGRGYFQTDKRRYSILDAPGHSTYVPNMIGGVSQADVGILVISARKGEYEAGFGKKDGSHAKGGQTKEHAVLAKTQGLKKLVVVVNKMDDATVEWSEARYTECTSELFDFLRRIGYSKKDLTFMPVSAQTGLNIRDRISKDAAPWYDGPSLLDCLDGMTGLKRDVKGPFMMPVATKHKDKSMVAEGKIISGGVKKGDQVLILGGSYRKSTTVSAVYGETEEEVGSAMSGDHVRLKLRNVEEDEVGAGFVVCSPSHPVHCVGAFEAQLVIQELQPGSVISAGSSCVCHVHAAQVEVSISQLLHRVEKGTGRRSKKPPVYATQGMSIIARMEVAGGGSICVERFEDVEQFGRFTLRDQGQTIAIGKVLSLVTE